MPYRNYMAPNRQKNKSLRIQTGILTDQALVHSISISIRMRLTCTLRTSRAPRHKSSSSSPRGKAMTLWTPTISLLKSKFALQLHLSSSVTPCPSMISRDAGPRLMLCKVVLHVTSWKLMTFRVRKHSKGTDPDKTLAASPLTTTPMSLRLKENRNAAQIL